MRDARSEDSDVLAQHSVRRESQAGASEYQYGSTIEETERKLDTICIILKSLLQTGPAIILATFNVILFGRGRNSQTCQISCARKEAEAAVKQSPGKTSDDQEPSFRVFSGRKSVDNSLSTFRGVRNPDDWSSPGFATTGRTFGHSENLNATKESLRIRIY